MVSIKDIARKCNVSIATVSKALNDCTDISEKTKMMVRAVADELGYFPNSQAKALKTSRTNTIGVIYTNRLGSGFRHIYFSSVIESFKNAVEKQGYDLVFIGSGSKDMNCGTYYEHCKHRNVDGVLIACTDFYDREVNRVLRSELPVVVVDFFSKRDYSVCSDNRQGMRDIIEYVYEMGHRRIAYIYGDTSQMTTVRLDTFTETMKQLGMPVLHDYVCQGRYNDMKLAEELVTRMLSLYEPPTCIVMPDDVSAFGAFAAARKLGIGIPDDLSVVGYDGITFGQIQSPELTTVFQNTELLGARSAELLLSRINNEEISELRKHTLVETKLLRGQTVKKLTL
jgi:DNA-binding LacI/PurR family transcriptional regulator